MAIHFMYDAGNDFAWYGNEPHMMVACGMSFDLPKNWGWEKVDIVQDTKLVTCKNCLRTEVYKFYVEELDEE